MKKLFFVFLLTLTWIEFVSAQASLTKGNSKQLLKGIRENFTAGAYQSALDSCVYIVSQRDRLTSDYVFEALYYASAISIYNGNPEFTLAFMRKAEDYLPVDTFICNKHSRYRLLEAEFLTESGRYEAAMDSITAIREGLGTCDFKWKFITLINYHRVRARIVTQKGKALSPDVLFSPIDSLDQISTLIAKEKGVKDSLRLQLYINLYQAEIYWLNAWSIFENKKIEKLERDKLIKNNADRALRELGSLDKTLSKYGTHKFRRIKIQSIVLRAQILGSIRLEGEPLSSRVIGDSFFNPEKAISYLLKCQELQEEYEVFKEYNYTKNLIRQLVLMYWEYRNKIKYGDDQCFSLDTILSELGMQEKSLSIRSVYGNPPISALIDSSALRYPLYEAIDIDQSLKKQSQDLLEEQQSLENQYTNFWWGLSLLLFPFTIALYLFTKLERESKQKSKQFHEVNAELEAALYLIEELNEDQAETSEKLGGAKSDAKFRIQILEAKVAQKEEDIKHLKMELSHRLVNQLLYLSSTIESDAEDESIDREELASSAITRLKNAIKLQRVLEDYDNRTSVYFPAYFNALEKVVNQAFHMSINLNCAELGVENQVPYDFARDLGQLIIEWLFLLADIPVDRIRVFAEPTSDQLKLSIIISEDDWKKMGAPMDFSALEQENPKITKKISFYLRKYRRVEAALLTVSQSKSQISLTSLLNF